MIEIITMTALLVLCGWLSWRVSMLEARLRNERTRRKQAERMAERAQRRYRRTVEINHQLAQQKPVYFRDVPTLDGTAYIGETYPSPVVWWTYDN
jgi:hypothetical protein